MTNNEQHQELHVAPLHEDYAGLEVTEAFDWPAIIEDARQQRGIGKAALYLVVFRSHLKEDADRELLEEHDAQAHDAARQSPALLTYFGGKPNEEGRALSFCLWTDADEAKAISRDSRHAAAQLMVKHYAAYSLEKYDVHHGNGDIRFEARQ